MGPTMMRTAAACSSADQIFAQNMRAIAQVQMWTQTTSGVSMHAAPACMQLLLILGEMAWNHVHTDWLCPNQLTRTSSEWLTLDIMVEQASHHQPHGPPDIGAALPPAAVRPGLQYNLQPVFRISDLGLLVEADMMHTV
jgi:hypothetical protein